MESKVVPIGLGLHMLLAYNLQLQCKCDQEKALHTCGNTRIARTSYQSGLLSIHDRVYQLRRSSVQNVFCFTLIIYAIRVLSSGFLPCNLADLGHF